MKASIAVMVPHRKERREQEESEEEEGQTGLLRGSEAGAEPVPEGGWNPPGRRKKGVQPRAAGPEPGGVTHRDSS